jgi:hypothetical protein
VGVIDQDDMDSMLKETGDDGVVNGRDPGSRVWCSLRWLAQVGPDVVPGDPGHRRPGPA